MGLSLTHASVDNGDLDAGTQHALRTELVDLGHQVRREGGGACVLALGLAGGAGHARALAGPVHLVLGDGAAVGAEDVLDRGQVGELVLGGLSGLGILVLDGHALEELVVELNLLDGLALNGLVQLIAVLVLVLVQLGLR